MIQILTILENHRAYKQALIFNPEHVGAVVNIGYCLKEMGSSKEAKAAYLRAIRIAPNYDKALVNCSNFFISINVFNQLSFNYFIF